MNALPNIQDFDDPNFDPFVADELLNGEIADIYTPLAKLRRQAPVVEGNYLNMLSIPQSLSRPDRREFTVLSYEHSSAVFSDPESYSQESFLENLGKTFGRTLTAMDAPEHSRYRRIFQKAFLPQTVAKWGDTIVAPVINGLMAKFAGRTEADLGQEFAATYPFAVIYRQLGLPEAEGAVFHRLAVAQTLVYNDEAHAFEASRKLGAFFAALIATRRKVPSDDLASELINATVDGETLPDEVIGSFLRQLINAAGDTTLRGTSVFLTALLQHPEQLAALRADRSLMPQAIEEALRWDSPLTWTLRQAARDTVLGGVEIPKGSWLYVVIGSANRDEAWFPDPDRFDIYRDRKHRNIAFAIGPHICLGQHLARLEMTRAVNAILDRMPNLRFDPDKSPAVIRGTTLRIARRIHVRFDA
jgi:cytochrome P450